MKKGAIITVICGLLLIIFSISAFAIDADAKGTLFCQNDVVYAKQSLDIFLTIEPGINGICGVSIEEIKFDHEYLELTSVELATELNGWCVFGNNYPIMIVDDSGSNVLSYGQELVLILHFYPKRDVSQTEIEIEGSATDSELNEIQLIVEPIAFSVNELAGMDECSHSSTSTKNVVEPSCIFSGYTGDVICNECGAILDKGTTVPPLGHKNTAVINSKESSCIEEGYTGDLYCYDCQEVIEYGCVLPLIDHMYQDGKCIKCFALEDKKDETTFSENGNEGAQLTWLYIGGVISIVVCICIICGFIIRRRGE